MCDSGCEWRTDGKKEERKIKRQSFFSDYMSLCACLSQQRRHPEKISRVRLTHTDVLLLRFFFPDPPQINIVHPAHIEKAFHVIPVDPDDQKPSDKAYPSILQELHLMLPRNCRQSLITLTSMICPDIFMSSFE